ncbi:hypothetical protein E4U46_000103 [Claviceps purpurea]|nr:hypothetical protein E4U46_000103 [Claviceps purpurea]
MEDNPDSLESAQQRDDAPKVLQQGSSHPGWIMRRVVLDMVLACIFVRIRRQEERQPRRAPTKKSANQEERQPRRAPTKKSANQYHRMLCSIDALSVLGNS